jgi:outer membrane protein OmpA-like peptidoglycan-associated protein
MQALYAGKVADREAMRHPFVDILIVGGPMCRFSVLAFAAIAASLIAAPQSSAESLRFSFTYVKGEKFRALSTVDEDVFVNGRFARSSQILNRISFETADADPEGAWGLVRGKFETSERAAGDSAYLVSESYDSEFTRDRLGKYTIDPAYYMPVVRDVPSFPDAELSPGDSWSAPGEERHDFRLSFGIPEPYEIPIDVRYRYIGPVARDGRTSHLISASYTVFERPRAPRAYNDVYPVQIAGYSDQKIYWDPALGQPSAYEESFDLIFDWSDGSTVEYRGKAGSEVVESRRMDRDALKDEIEKAVAGLPNVSVAATEDGIAISLEDIQFEADSSTLRAAELEKVARVADILKRYPDRDILVSGHSAAAGYAAGRKPLSEDRAKAVAERLIALGARRPEHVRAAGYGDERPIADNSTEAGRGRNRRVEITILEN